MKNEDLRQKLKQKRHSKNRLVQ